MSLIFFQFVFFISFSSLIAMARTFKTMFNSGESGHPFLVCNLRGNVFSFPVLRMMWKWKSFSRVWLRPLGLYSPWHSLAQNTEVGSLSFLQGVFLTQGSNPGLLHCRWLLYQLSHREAREWCEFVAYGLYYVEVVILYAHFLESWYHTWVLNFVKAFSALM